MKLNKEQGINALTDGFSMIFGEKYKPFFHYYGEEIVELGLHNGKKWCNNIVLKKTGIDTWFRMYNDGILKENDIKIIENQLQNYFSKEDINIFKKGTSKLETRENYFMKGLEKYIKNFSYKIDDKDISYVTAIPFNYFKNFKIDARNKIDLYGESGLQLDDYTIQSLRFYDSNDEMFFMIENIPLKYHYFGMLLAKQEALESWIDIIKYNLNPNNHRIINSSLTKIIYNLSISDAEADNIILDIQKNIPDASNFMTHKQLAQSLRQIK